MHHPLEIERFGTLQFREQAQHPEEEKQQGRDIPRKEEHFGRERGQPGSPEYQPAIGAARGQQ